MAVKRLTTGLLTKYYSPVQMFGKWFTFICLLIYELNFTNHGC